MSEKNCWRGIHDGRADIWYPYDVTAINHPASDRLRHALTFWKEAFPEAWREMVGHYKANKLWTCAVAGNTMIFEIQERLHRASGIALVVVETRKQDALLIFPVNCDSFSDPFFAIGADGSGGEEYADWSHLIDSNLRHRKVQGDFITALLQTDSWIDQMRTYRKLSGTDLPSGFSRNDDEASKDSPIEPKFQVWTRSVNSNGSVNFGPANGSGSTARTFPTQAEAEADKESWRLMFQPRVELIVVRLDYTVVN